MHKCLLFLIAVISLLLVGCGSSTQEDFANRVDQAMRAPANDPTTTASLGSMRRVAMSAANSSDSISITPDQLFDWAEATYPKFFPTREKTLTWNAYQFRYYKDTDVYLAVENSINVVALGKPTKNELMTIGKVGDFKSSIYNILDPFTNVRNQNLGQSQLPLKNQYLYSNPGLRLSELQKLSDFEKSIVCKPSWTLVRVAPRLLKPLLNFDQVNGSFDIPEPLEFAAGQDINFYLSRQSAAYTYYTNLWLRDGNWLAGRDVIKSMANWADADALRLVRTPSSCFQCYRHALAILLNLDTLRSHSYLTPETLTKILKWVKVFLTNIHIFTDLPKGNAGILDLEQRYNNHNAIRAQLLMAWSILTNDPEGFELSIKNGYLRSLESIRFDGSFYWDSQRGNWAILYSNFMVGFLVNIAEMAYGQGVDLYPLKNSIGKNLHDSIDFLMRARKNFELINVYAKENITNGGGPFTGIQDLSPFSQRKTEWDLWISWMERYRNRFKGINQDIDSIVLALRPMVSETDGLATCLSGLSD